LEIDKKKLFALLDIDESKLPIDRRQIAFLGAVQKIIEEEQPDEIAVNYTRGFPASYVDLGFLQECMGKLQKLNLLNKEIIELLIVSLVCRVKSLNIKETETHWYVEFTTEDDYGYYDYRFSYYKESDLGKEIEEEMRIDENSIKEDIEQTIENAITRKRRKYTENEGLSGDDIALR